MHKLNKTIIPLSISIFAVIFVAFFLQTIDARGENNAFVQPVKILVNPETNKAFVLNEEGSNIAVFDGAKRVLLGNIPTGGDRAEMMKIINDNIYVLNRNTKNIVIFPSLFTSKQFDQATIRQLSKDIKIIKTDPDFFATDFDVDDGLKKVYMINGENNIISIIDEVTGKISRLKLGIGSIPSYPAYLFVNQTDHKVSIVGGDGNLFILNGENDNIVKTTTLSNKFLWVPSAVIDNSKEKIFIAAYEEGSQNIYIVDAKNGELISKIDITGKHPVNLSINNSTKKLYCANEFEGSVSVFDIQTKKLIKTIPISAGALPDVMTIDEVANLVFVPNTGLNRVTVIDGSKDEIVANLNAGVGLMWGTVNYKTGDFYVPNRLSNSITIISQNKVRTFQEETIPNNKNIASSGDPFSDPIRIAINEEKNELYVLNKRGADFIVIDAQNYQVKDKIPVGQNPEKIISIPELNKVAVSVGDEDKVVLYDILTKVTQTVSVGDHPAYLLFNPKTSKLYVNNFYSHDLSVVDPGKGTTTSNIPLGGRCEEIILNKKENKIYVAGLTTGEVIIIDGNTDQIQEKIKVGGSIRSLFYDDVYNKLYAINPTANETEVIDTYTNKVIGSVKTEIRYNSRSMVAVNGIENKNDRKIFLPSFAIEIINAASQTIFNHPILPSGVPAKIIYGENERKKYLYVLTQAGLLDVVELKSNDATFLGSHNIFQLSKSLQGLNKGMPSDAVFSQKIKKLFIVTGEANSLAVFNAKENKIESLITNNGVEKIAYPDTSNIWFEGMWKFLINRKFLVIFIAGSILILFAIYIILYLIKKRG